MIHSGSKGKFTKYEMTESLLESTPYGLSSMRKNKSVLEHVSQQKIKELTLKHMQFGDRVSIGLGGATQTAVLDEENLTPLQEFIKKVQEVSGEDAEWL